MVIFRGKGVKIFKKYWHTHVREFCLLSESKIRFSIPRTVGELLTILQKVPPKSGFLDFRIINANLCKNQIFPRHVVSTERQYTMSTFTFDNKKYTSMIQIFLKMVKTFKNGHFLHNQHNYAKMRFFFKNPALSVLFPQDLTTPCQILEKTNDGKYDNFW